MLNEIKEYSIYLSEGYCGLIRRDNINDGFKGLRYVLTLLARGFLDDCYKEGIVGINEQHRYTESFLKVWLVGELVSELKDGESVISNVQELSKYPVLKNRLQRAKKANLLSYMDSLNNNSRSNKAKLFARIREWSKPIFECDDKQSLNAIYFRNMIADALDQGSLTHNVLVFHSRLKNDYVSGKRSSEDHFNILLGIVSVYLQSRTENVESVPIVIAQLSNYLGKRCNKDSNDVYGSISPFIAKSGYSYEGKPILVKRMVGSSITKLTVNSDWLREYDIHLVPANTPLLLGYAKYADAPVLKRLEKNAKAKKEEQLLI